MKVCCVLTVLGVSLSGAVDASKSQLAGTPVQKVTQLLQGMLEKGKKEKHEEQLMWAESRQFCESEQSIKEVAIKEEEQTIEHLGAEIEKDTADAGTLQKKIQALGKDGDVFEGDVKAATKVRQIEKADYDNTHRDYSEAIDAVNKAVMTLKKQSHDRKQATSFSQVSRLKSLTILPTDAKKTINLFLQQGSDNLDTELDTAAPEVNAYEFQAHGVIAMLEKLGDKFTDERTNLEKEEANAKNSYSMLMKDLENQIDQALRDKDAKQQSRAKVLMDKADLQGDQKSVQEVKTVDERYLADMKATCKMKASDFEARQKLRTEEIQSIEKAIEIISGKAVAGNAEKHLPKLLQSPGSPSVASIFGQLRSDSNHNAMAKMQRLSVFLRTRAADVNSRILAAVALRAAADPFQKVKKMLKDLVVHLMEEANEEAEHKGFCDGELSTNKQTRQEKSEMVETLHADIDSLTASIAKIREDISNLQTQLAELDNASKEETRIRTKEKAKNTATIADAQDAQAAVSQALTVLRDFYAKAAESTSFLQQPYTGMESSGVTGMLEVLQSDFVRLESDTKQAEASAITRYDKFTSDTRVDKASKSTEAEHREAKLQDETQALNAKKSDLDGSQKELDAALAYYDKLKPSCVDAGMSYETRVTRRKEEVQSLQEGLKILNGDDIA